jgi:hypothetical protein
MSKKAENCACGSPAVIDIRVNPRKDAEWKGKKLDGPVTIPSCQKDVMQVTRLGTVVSIEPRDKRVQQHIGVDEDGNRKITMEGSLTSDDPDGIEMDVVQVDNPDIYKSDVQLHGYVTFGLDEYTVWVDADIVVRDGVSYIENIRQKSIEKIAPSSLPSAVMPQSAHIEKFSICESDVDGPRR